MYIPRTQITICFYWKGLVSGGCPSKIEVIGALGIYIFTYIYIYIQGWLSRNHPSMILSICQIAPLLIFKDDFKKNPSKSKISQIWWMTNRSPPVIPASNSSSSGQALCKAYQIWNAKAGSINLWFLVITDHWKPFSYAPSLESMQTCTDYFPFIKKKTIKQ